MTPVPLALFFLLWTCSQSLAKVWNTTVDDQDPRIKYYPTLPSWGKIHEIADANGTHMLTTNAGAYATIKFTWVNAYIMSPRWPYPVSTGLQLDDQPPVHPPLQLQDNNVPLAGTDSPATRLSGIVHKFTGTTMKEHTIRVFIPSGGQQAVIDMFMFEVDDSSSTTTSSTTTSSSSTTTSSTTTSSTTTSSTTTSTTQSTSVDSITTTASSSVVPPIDTSSQNTGPTSALSSTTSATATASPDSSPPSTTKIQGWKIGVGIGICVLGLLLLLVLWQLCIRRKQRPGNNRRRAHMAIDPSPSNIWGDTTPPLTTIREGNGFQYGPLPLMAEAPFNPSTATPVSRALYDDPFQIVSEHTPLYDSDAVGGPTSTGSRASAYSDGREIPKLNFDEVRQSGASWDSGYPQPLKFIPIG